MYAILSPIIRSEYSVKISFISIFTFLTIGIEIGKFLKAYKGKGIIDLALTKLNKNRRLEKGVFKFFAIISGNQKYIPEIEKQFERKDKNEQ